MAKLKVATTSKNKTDFNKLQPLNDEELDSWWRTVPGARRFTGEIMAAVDEHCAIAAHIPPEDEAGLIQILTEKIQRKYISQIVEIFEYDGKGDIEDFADALTAKFEPNFRRDFTKDSPLEDLAQQNSFAGYVIIIKLKNKLKWLTAAVTDFNRSNSLEGGALIFITTEENPPPSITRLSDFLTPYDVQFFVINLLENARLNSQQKLYTSTLAAKLSKQSALIAKNLAKTELYNYGLDFVRTVIPKFDANIFNRAVWECQAQFLLPALEQIRTQLIEKNFLMIKRILPKTDEFGRTLEEPYDMELRHLHHYGGKFQIFQYSEWEILELAYEARNALSHLKTIDLLPLEKIFSFVK